MGKLSLWKQNNVLKVTQLRQCAARICLWVFQPPKPLLFPTVPCRCLPSTRTSSCPLCVNLGLLCCRWLHCLPSPLPLQQRDLNSFLWTIRRDPPAYLFGTIHVPYTRVWDFIPDNSKAAFQASARVYFELDLTDPYTISALASCQLLPHGENLQDVLPRELYWRLKRHLDYVKLMMPSWMTPAQRGKGLYADYLFNAIAGNWERKRPVWVMLMVNSLTETDVRSRGVPVLDLYLAQQAEKMKKSTGAVERVEEQCHPLNGLNFSQVGTWHLAPCAGQLLCAFVLFDYLPSLASSGLWSGSPAALGVERGHTGLCWSWG